MADERELIRSRIDIVELVGQRVSLKKAGKDWKGLCPFHDDRNPSLHVSRDKGLYKCYSCGEGGDVYKWVMQTEHVDFPEALRILAKLAGVELTRHEKKDRTLAEAQEAVMAEAQAFFKDQLEKSSSAQDYCRQRGLDPATVEAWGLGYGPDVTGALAIALQRKGHRLNLAEELFLVKSDGHGAFDDRFKGRLMFPIRDERGRLVAFGGRIIGDGQPKYINSGDTPLYSKSRVLYGLDKAKESMAKSRQAVLVEGYLDVIACHRSGVTSAVASLGTALADEHVRLLRRWCDEVVVLYDSDAAGLKAAERACALLTEGGLKARVSVVSAGKDPDTLLRDQGAAAVRKLVEKPMTALEYLLAQLEARHPATGEAFWDEAAGILAQGKRHQEVVGLVDMLVPKYPFTKDRTLARLNIERSIRAARVRNRNAATPARASVSSSVRERMVGSEATVIKAVLRQELRNQAVDACREPDLFVTAAGTRLAQAVVEELGGAVPAGPVSSWLPNVRSDELRDALWGLEAEVLPNRDLQRVEQESFEAAVVRLRTQREDRKRHGLQVDLSDKDAVLELQRRLRSAKGADTIAPPD
ncbi:MAG: DNA primase [Armatimonadetes bacterium]|nr:DNA primase [Armatimonadota bacterium]